MNPCTEMSDEKLIQFYLNGNPAAMATLVELYKDRIYSSIYASVQEKYAAEEIFQDVFIRCIDNLIAGQMPEDGNFLQWAMKLSHTLCVEHAKTRRPVILSKNMKPETTISVSPNEPMYFQRHGEIKTMIDMLPEDQREVIMLNHYAGLSLSDITDIMKCSLSTALDTLKFGLDNLRKMMTEKSVVIQ